MAEITTEREVLVTRTRPWTKVAAVLSGGPVIPLIVIFLFVFAALFADLSLIHI